MSTERTLNLKLVVSIVIQNLCWGGGGGGGNDKFVILIVFNRAAIRLVQYQPVWRELSEPLIMRRRGSEN